MRSHKFVHQEKEINKRNIFEGCKHGACGNARYSYCSMCKNINHLKEPLRETIPKSKKILTRKKRSSTSKERDRSLSKDTNKRPKLKSRERIQDQEMLANMKRKMENQKKLISHLIDKVEQNDEDIHNLKCQTRRIEKSNSPFKSSIKEHEEEESLFIKNLKRKYGKENYDEAKKERIYRDNRTISLNIQSPYLDDYRTNKGIPSKEAFAFDSHKYNDSSSNSKMKQEYEIKLDAANKRITLLESDIKAKDKMILSQEQSFLQKIHSLQDRLELVEKENFSNSDLQREIDNYRKRLELKQKELEITKASFAEKLEKEKNYHKQRKKDWKSIYGALLEDIGRLKEELAQTH